MHSPGDDGHQGVQRATAPSSGGHEDAGPLHDRTRARRCRRAFRRRAFSGARPWPVVSSAECRQSCRFATLPAELPRRESPYAGETWCPRLESNQRHQVEETRGRRDLRCLTVCDCAARSEVLQEVRARSCSGALGRGDLSCRQRVGSETARRAQRYDCEKPSSAAQVVGHEASFWTLSRGLDHIDTNLLRNADRREHRSGRPPHVQPSRAGSWNRSALPLSSHSSSTRLRRRRPTRKNPAAASAATMTATIHDELAPLSVAAAVLGRRL